MKIENAHTLHSDIFKAIKEAEIEQDWLSDDCVKCKISNYTVQCTRDEILNKVVEFVNENYVLKQ